MLSDETDLMFTHKDQSESFILKIRITDIIWRTNLNNQQVQEIKSVVKEIENQKNYDPHEECLDLHFYEQHVSDFFENIWVGVMHCIWFDGKADKWDDKSRFDIDLFENELFDPFKDRVSDFFYDHWFYFYRYEFKNLENKKKENQKNQDE